jgi:hypothetical protein
LTKGPSHPAARRQPELFTARGKNAKKTALNAAASRMYRVMDNFVTLIWADSG